MKPYYEHAGVAIYHGDCREILPKLPKLGGLDLVLTNPPYGIAWSRGVNLQRYGKPHDGIKGDEDTSCRDEALDLLASVRGVVFGSFYAQFPQRLKQVIVWRKPADWGLVGSITGFRRDAEPVFLTGNWPPLTVRWSSVFSVSRGMSAITTETGHPHTKPVSLLEELIQRANALSVIDPFMGSGSTLVAAKNLGRRAAGIEIEERYCEVAVKRLSQEVMCFDAAPLEEYPV
jgi:DNA modification methylase